MKYKEDVCSKHKKPDCMECFYTTSAELPKKDICPVCSFEDGHTPNCIEGENDPKWQVQLILSDVYYSKYGTKNRVELIMRLEEVIELLP